MREIKFKGLTNGEKWIYGSLVYSKNIQCAIYYEISNGVCKSFDWSYVKPDSVGQYTGLKDKNGKEIYESDIVCLDRLKDSRWKIEYSGASFVGIPLKQNSLINHRVLSNNNYFQFEVIGNIHENPELLK